MRAGRRLLVAIAVCVALVGGTAPAAWAAGKDPFGALDGSMRTRGRPTI